jgi:Rrf2 family protein
MKRNGRFSFALHALLHLAQSPGGEMTSTQMAACSATHAVVIRQTFAGLRAAGIVSSRRGRGGGWRLTRPPSEITLEQVQRALGERVVGVATAEESPGCLVERVVHDTLDGAVAEANRILDQRLATVSLADLAEDVHRLAGQGFTMSRGDHGQPYTECG